MNTGMPLWCKGRRSAFVWFVVCTGNLTFTNNTKGTDPFVRIQSFGPICFSGEDVGNGEATCHQLDSDQKLCTPSCIVVMVHLNGITLVSIELIYVLISFKYKYIIILEMSCCLLGMNIIAHNWFCIIVYIILKYG